MSDEEPVDPKIELAKKYHSHCEKQWKAYEDCGKRLEKLGKDSGKNCSGWYNEFYACLDHAVSSHTDTEHSKQEKRAECGTALLALAPSHPLSPLRALCLLLIR